MRHLRRPRLSGWFNRRSWGSEVEIEAKFRVPDAEVLGRLREATHLAGYALFAARTEQLSDTYLDTPRWQILAAGYACRRRLSGDRVLITVKQLRGPDDVVHRREEYEVDLAEFVPPAQWPESVARSKVLEMIDGQPLLEVLDLRQTRTTRLVGAADRPVAELSLDEVHLGEGDVTARAAVTPEPGASGQPDVITGRSDSAVQTPAEGSSSSPGRSDTNYFEVEVELKEAGTEKDLAALVRVLQKEWSLEPEPLSKFERAVAIAWEKPVLEATPEPAETAPGDSEDASGDDNKPTRAVALAEVSSPFPERADEASAKRARKHSRRQRFLGDGLEVLDKPGLRADDTMPEAADKTLLFHLQRMMQHEPGTREGEDAEELHVMRVATRRMRAALRVFGDYLDVEAFKPHLRLMQETGRELGTVRDLDVFQIKTQAYIDSLPVEEQSGLDPLMEAWATERERARREMIYFLDSNRYQHFKERFEHFLRTPGAGAGRGTKAEGEPLPTRVGDVLPAVLFERLSTVKAFDESISRGDAPLVRFHQLRIASKGLRYTLEFFQEVLGSDSKRLIEKTKLLQDHLGDLQDAVVTCDVLLGFLGSGTWGPPRQDRKDSRPLFPVNAPGVAVYLAVKQNEIERLMRTFGPVWDQIRGSEFSRPLAGLVAAL